jgi:hypothetical protein
MGKIMDQLEYLEINDYAERNSKKAISSIPNKLMSTQKDLPKRLAGSKLNPMSKLHRLYEAMDSMIIHLNKFSACKSGCSNCCYYPVTISDIEISFIEKREKIRRNLSPSKNPEDAHRGVACVFLDDGKCSIYSSRPFACRNLLSMAQSSKICDPKYAFDYEMPILQFGGFKQAFDLIRFEAGCGDEPYDIREAFLR